MRCIGVSIFARGAVVGLTIYDLDFIAINLPKGWYIGLLGICVLTVVFTLASIDYVYSSRLNLIIILLFIAERGISFLRGGM